MRMGTLRICFVFVCVMTLCLAGSIHARSVAAAPSEIAPTISPTAGKIVVSFEITIHSSIPSSDTVACEVTANVEGESTTFREVAARTGTRTGNHVGCDVPIPYSWLPQHPGSDSINLTFDTVLPPQTGPTVSLPYRQSESTETITPVPANGSTTNITIDVSL